MKTDTELQTFCGNIRKLRALKGLTQREMAQNLNISLYALRKIESGSLPDCVTIDIVFHIAKHFGIRPGRLFSPDLFP